MLVSSGFVTTLGSAKTLRSPPSSRDYTVVFDIELVISCCFVRFRYQQLVYDVFKYNWYQQLMPKSTLSFLSADSNTWYPATAEDSISNPLRSVLDFHSIISLESIAPPVTTMAIIKTHWCIVNDANFGCNMVCSILLIIEKFTQIEMCKSRNESGGENRYTFPNSGYGC